MIPPPSIPLPLLLTFSLGSHNCYVLPLVTRELLPHVLKSIHKIYRHSTQLYDVLKTAKQGGGVFLGSQKTKCYLGVISPCTILPCPFHKTSSSLFQFGQVENKREHLLEKIFLICFSLLSLQAEQKEHDEDFAHHLQLYVSRTVTKAKKSVMCPEYPMSSKLHLSK